MPHPATARMNRHIRCCRKGVTRRILAVFGFFLVIALAVTLLYRVYIHHTQAEPYEDDESAVVRLEVKIASSLR